MFDSFGREINYIRISVTDKCNLRCSYCIPKEGVPLCRHEDILSFNEIERILRILVKQGIQNVKLTGGEPFIRKDFLHLARRIKNLPGIEKLTVTTNGTFISRESVQEIMDVFDGINISLDTLCSETYKKITGRDAFFDAYNGFQITLKENQKRESLLPLKLNCVLTESNKTDVVKIAGLAKEYKIYVRFIELMPIGLGKEMLKQESHSLSEDEVKEQIEKAYGYLAPDFGNYGSGPAVYYNLDGFAGKIGFISACSHKFCKSCNRIRMTTEGCIKNCLQYEAGLDLRKLLRNGATDAEIEAKIIQEIKQKPSGHAFSQMDIEREEKRCMSKIGG